MPKDVAGRPVATRLLLPFAAGLLIGGLHADGGVGAALFVLAALGACHVAGSAAVRPAVSAALRITCAAAAAGVACGALRAVVAHLPPPPDHVVRFADGALAAVEGVVVQSDGDADRRALVVAVERLRTRRRAGPARGLVGVTIAHATRTWPAGTGVRLVGKLRRPRNFANPGAYDHVGAFARRGILAIVFLWDDAGVESRADSSESGALAPIRTRLLAHIAADTEEPVRGYLTAVLLGATQSLDRDTRDTLTRTGLSHVVSVSGFHIAVAAGACVLVLRRILLRAPWLALRADVTKVAAVLGLFPVAAYAALAGDSVPAARSFLTYGVLLAALAYDRPPDALRALACAAVLLALPVPDIAADVSFELSFASVLALILVARRERSSHRDRPSRWWRTWLVAPLRTSIAATVATAPLTAWHFQQISLVAPLANLASLPWLGPATLLPGLAALPSAFVSPRLADVLLLAAAAAAQVGLALARWFAAWQWAAVATPMPTLVELAIAYAALTLWWAGRGTGGRRGRRTHRAAVAAVTLAALGDVAYWTWERLADPTMRITFLSVGQGDAAVVELPRGGVLVIDGGGFPGDFDPGERLIAPFLRSRKILRVDVLVLSHPQLDHYGGLARVAEQFHARELWCNGTRGTGVRFAALERALRAAGTRPVTLRRGMTLPLGRDVVADVLHPDDPTRFAVNDASLVLRVRYGTRSVLFTGDIEHGAERALVADGARLRSDVLKVPHHGSATSTTTAWLAAVAPRVAVISSGADNRFGFPAADVVARLRAAGAVVWNTAEHGAIRVVVGPRGVSVVPTRASAAERFEFPQLLW